MSELTKKHPSLLVELSGEGEEWDDKWKTRYRNGEAETVRVQITWPEFKTLT